MLPRKQDDAAAKKFRYEGYDIITLQKLIEREYTIPEPQTAEEVIGYYARRIAQDVKLPSQFSALAPKVREFLETKAFGETVDFERACDDQGDQQQRGPIRDRQDIRRSAAKDGGRGIAAAASPRRTAACPKRRRSRGRARRLRPTSAIFNLVPCDNEFEKEFARFLQKADDVERFAKLPEQFGFAIEYTDNAGNLRYYEPDFVVLTTDGTHYIVETKGLEDINVANKDRAAKLWCENTTKLTGKPWAYLKVLQTAYKQLQPTRFEDLLVLDQRKLL